MCITLPIYYNLGYLASSDCHITSIDNWLLPHYNMKLIKDLKLHIIANCLHEQDTGTVYTPQDINLEHHGVILDDNMEIRSSGIQSHSTITISCPQLELHGQYATFNLIYEMPTD